MRPPFFHNCQQLPTQWQTFREKAHLTRVLHLTRTTQGDSATAEMKGRGGGVLYSKEKEAIMMMKN